MVLSPPLVFWDYRHVPGLCDTGDRTQGELGAFCMLDKHSVS